MQNVLEQGPDFWCWFDTTQFSYIPLCSPNTCEDVFNPNVTTFQSNCAEGLHFSAFHYYIKHFLKRSRSLLQVSAAEALSWFYRSPCMFLVHFLVHLLSLPRDELSPVGPASKAVLTILLGTRLYIAHP